MLVRSVVTAGLLATSCIAPEQAGFAPTSPTGPASSGGVAAELDDFFRKKEAAGFSGVVELSVGSKIALRQSYGVSGCDGPGVTPEGVFLVGSIVKDFTKLAIFKLASQGKLTLDDPISRWLPDVPPDKQGITIGMLLSHRSGLPDVIDAQGKEIEYTTAWDYLPVTREQIIARGMRASLAAPPDTDERYSNLGYALLAVIIEQASGQSYEAYLRQEVFQPLGMNHTGYVLPDLSGQQLVDGCEEGHRWKLPSRGGKWMIDGPSWNLRGNGGMVGTADDLMRWIGHFQDPSVLPSDLRDTYLAASTGMSRSFGQRAAASAGSNGIYNAYYLWLADDDLKLVMISNNSDELVEKYRDEVFAILRAHVNPPAP